MTATGSVRFGDVHAPGNDQTERSSPGPGGFTTVATAVVRGQGLGLSTEAKLLYVVLRSYAAPDGTCFPGYARLQDDVGCGINQLTRAMRELEGAGLVTRRRRGQGRPTLYTVHAPHSPTPDPAQFHRWSESRLTAGVNQDSPLRGAEQDSGDLDPEEQHHRTPPSPRAPFTTNVGDLASAGGDDDVFTALISHGITPRVAHHLATTHDAEAIREQLAWHGYRPSARNPAGALVQAIRERWPVPQALVEAQEHAAAVARQAEEERRRQAEDEARRREWATKTPEERIAGRLAFWIQGRRVKRHEPTEAEIAVRRAELLAELAAAPPAGGVS